eukprot:7394436-Lingulodinium_polyedra.AAC.1
MPAKAFWRQRSPAPAQVSRPAQALQALDEGRPPRHACPKTEVLLQPLAVARPPNLLASFWLRQMA